MPTHHSIARTSPASAVARDWSHAPDGDLMAWASDAADKGATTVYLRAGSLPVVRVDDRLDPVGSSALDEPAVNQLISDLEEGGDQSWQRGGDGEWVRLDATLGRVTCRLFTDDEGRGLIIRLQPSAAARGLHRLVPRKVKAACDGDGLIVVSSTSTDEALALASSVADLAARRRGGYVVVLRPDGAQRPQVSGSFVSQREFAPTDAPASIRGAVAESPDILLVALPQAEGTGREIARASEGGRLVVVATPAATSLQAVRSLIGRGSSVGDAQVRLSLAGTFRAAFTTRTLRRLGGGRTTVQDLLLGTSDVSSLIASGDFAGATRLQRQGVSGMFTVDERLARGVRRGHLPLRQAAENALDRRHLVSLVRSAGRTVRHSADTEGQLQPVGVGRGSSTTRWS
jgi:Tfp pilus assembly pilus retraction ATPase PilT